MKEGTTKSYRGYIIYLNYWGEYCACHNTKYLNMVTYNSSFKTEKEAKIHIDNILK